MLKGTQAVSTSAQGCQGPSPALQGLGSQRHTLNEEVGGNWVSRKPQTLGCSFFSVKREP